MRGTAGIVREPTDNEPPFLARRRYTLDGAPWKLRGAVYTPGDVAAALARWAIRGAADRVLDPACGDGAFLAAAGSRLRALGAKVPRPVGVDVDDMAAEESGGEHADFFEWADGKQPFQAIVGNPPFIRSHVFEEASRARAFRLMVRMGLRPSRLMSSWAPFLAISCSLLTPDGRLAFVLPEELLQVGYARELRAYLLRRFRRVMVCFPPRETFPQVQQSVVLLLCDSAWDGPQGLSVASYKSLVAGRVEAVEAPPWDWCEKWSHLHLSASERRLLIGGLDALGWEQLRAYARVEVGVVTGSNRFFVVPQEQARALGPRFVRPAVTSTRDLAGIRLTNADFARVASAGRPAYLFSTKDPKRDLPAQVVAYIHEGERQGVHEQYKCRNREPWHAVPSAQASDAALFRQIGDYARLIQFEARRTPTDTLHRLWWRAGVDGDAMSAAFLNTWTLLATEITGRSYGGGVLEIMPREAASLPVPAPDRKVGALHEKVDALIRATQIRDAIHLVDAAVLPRAIGPSDRSEAAEILGRLIQRRKGRRGEMTMER